jgi:hypothetical protein
MLLVVTKTLLTPLLLALCTFVSHRWGDVVGGWMLGLPLVSGPVSLFLTLQHGASFAEAAARSTLLGFVACGIFCLTYLALADTHSWKLSLTGSVAACITSIVVLAFVHLPLAPTVVAVALALLAINALVGSPLTSRQAPAPAPSLRGVAGRMALAGVLVLALTSSSGMLGGTLSGLLAPLPVLAALMSAAAHRREGAAAVRGMLRGLVVGMWGGVAFFAVAALLLGAMAPLATYSLAIVAAGLAGWIATSVAAWHPALRLEQHFHDAALGRALHRFDRVRERVALGDQRCGIDFSALEQAYRRSERAAA